METLRRGGGRLLNRLGDQPAIGSEPRAVTAHPARVRRPAGSPLQRCRTRSAGSRGDGNADRIPGRRPRSPWMFLLGSSRGSGVRGTRGGAVGHVDGMPASTPVTSGSATRRSRRRRTARRPSGRRGRCSRCTSSRRFAPPLDTDPSRRPSPSPGLNHGDRSRSTANREAGPGSGKSTEPDSRSIARSVTRRHPEVARGSDGIAGPGPVTDRR